MKKYYYESVGEVVNQVYEIKATSWEEAKKVAFKDMEEGDNIAECPPSAVKEYNKFPEFHYIDKEQCTEYATLCKGTWALKPSGEEYYEDEALYFDDDTENFYNNNFEKFEDWKQDEDE